jgi:hypothetical protein
MNPITQEVCRILDFPEHRYDIAFKEAVNREKLTSTWMFLNGELVYISYLNYKSNVAVYSTYDNGGLEAEVKTLEVWLPETGLYSCKLGTLYLAKRPIKQWKKSFNPNFYTAEGLGKGKMLDYAKLYPLIAKEKPQQIKSIGGKLYLFNKIIGNVVDSKVSITEPKFEQEVVDFIRKDGTLCLT